ncbi:MAG TPA: serine hydrolase domain-containing protein [Thermoanaerobaculia bacterium]|jgi:CubicO group peptidase (beta-lactamase class C family)|nr:serine hydrolase domain-containing protein [Thermoanaerobaculia bacterium]
MRASHAVAFVLAAAFLLPPTVAAAETAAAQPAPERLAADSPRTTVRGNTFVAPAGWTLSVRGPATVLEAPEGDSWIALVDVDAADADAAVAAAWAAYKPAASWPLKLASDRPDRDGWSKARFYDYQTSPNERRDVFVLPRFANGSWLVLIYDVSQPVGEKRAAQIGLVFDHLFPRGYERETFAGKTAHPLTPERLAELRRFVETGRQALKVPGVAIGIVQGGKVVFAEGFGVRELGDPKPVDADTLFIVASNTKAMTTLLLAKLVEQGKLSWDTPVTSLFPSFKLGDADTTRQVLVKHLICACTGMPRQDFEWILEYGALTPQSALAMLGTMQPTSKFGEMFQYSNLMAGAAGYMAAHVLYPDMELGAGYDRAMQTYVFDPLGMRSTTLDFSRALAGDHASAHAPDIDGKPAVAPMAVNTSVVPLRPAGGAWSNVGDMLRYVQMELDEGMLPDGTRYIAKGPLLARRDKQVPLGNDATYGMGLMVDKTYGIQVVHHGGDLIGHHSDMIWLPGQNVGAVVLTNGDPGWTLRDVFRRKLLEVLFDGKPEADERLAAAAKVYYEALAADRKLMTVPADAAAGAKLAARYGNASLGEIAVSHAGAATVFDFGEWKSEVATRANPDGTVSFLTTAPGLGGFEFVPGTSGEKRSLVTRDAQHEYVFVEQ